MADLGEIDFLTFPPRSHDWATGMSYNLLKASTIMRCAALSATTPLPLIASANDIYINPDDGRINVWLGTGFHQITPSDMFPVFIVDENQFRQWREDDSEWVVLPNELAGPVPRDLSFYAPSYLRPNTQIFRYICGQEFTLPAGAIGSVARLETANSFDITMDMTGGTLSFAAGSTVGVFNIPSDVILQPTLVESEFSTAGAFGIRTRDTGLLDCMGLHVTIRGSIRPIAEG